MVTCSLGCPRPLPRLVLSGHRGAVSQCGEEDCEVEAGRKTEVEIPAGRVVELRKQYAVPAPVNETLYRILRITERYLQ
jgi:hypothetical protein